MDGERISVVIDGDSAGLRLDQAIFTLLKEESWADGLSRSKVGSWIDDGRVSQRGVEVRRASRMVQLGEVFELVIPPLQFKLVPDPEVTFPVLFEDETVLVIDKPAGVIVHPGVGGESATLAHGLVARYGVEYSAVGHPLRPGIVHRLDRGTSGLMVIARTAKAYVQLQEQFLPPRTVTRKYLAVVQSLPKTESELIDLPLGRDPNNRVRFSVQKSGRDARTKWRMVEAFGFGYLLELELETGRTHQIRVHLEAVSAPILGDPLYGPHNLAQKAKLLIKSLQRQALHAWKLSFLHPVTKVAMHFSSSPPEDFLSLIERCRAYSKKMIEVTGQP